MAAERLGSRWLHEPPDESMVKEWFTAQHLHSGMDHESYVGGVVIIPDTETFKVTREKENGDPYVVEEERAVFVPYMNVPTRVAYFWDLLAAMNGDEDKYLGRIEPMKQRIIEDPASPYYNAHLPDGFFVYMGQNRDSTWQRGIGCKWVAEIYERESEHSILRGEGTKIVEAGRQYVDIDAPSRAETGAIGRALGVAGILVVGTGVASAEEVQAARASRPGDGAAPLAALPEVVGPPAAQAPAPTSAAAPAPDAPQPQLTPEQADEGLRQRALQIQAEMQADFPDAWTTYLAWYEEARKGLPLSELKGAPLQGAVVKLQRDLDAAQQLARLDDKPKPDGGRTHG